MCVERITVRLVRQRADELSNLDDLCGVEPDRRLVEDEHGGLVYERLRETDALAIAFERWPHSRPATFSREHSAMTRSRAAFISRRGTPFRRATWSRYEVTFISRYRGGCSGR
jgi:hypothetical protein